MQGPSLGRPMTYGPGRIARPAPHWASEPADPNRRECCQVNRTHIGGLPWPSYVWRLLIINVDNTILNVALPTLVRDLHATSSQFQWIVDTYAMVFAGLLLVGGSLADRFGRRRFFLIGLTVFALGSIGAAFSGSVTVLIAFGP